jgi:hypothetical protein
MSNFLVFCLELLLVKLIKVEITLMFLGVAMLAAEDVLAPALNTCEADLLFASPAPSLVLLLKRKFNRAKFFTNQL